MGPGACLSKGTKNEPVGRWARGGQERYSKQGGRDGLEHRREWQDQAGSAANHQRSPIHQRERKKKNRLNMKSSALIRQK